MPWALIGFYPLSNMEDYRKIDCYDRKQLELWQSDIEGRLFVKKHSCFNVEYNPQSGGIRFYGNSGLTCFGDQTVTDCWINIIDCARYSKLLEPLAVCCLTGSNIVMGKIPYISTGELVKKVQDKYTPQAYTEVYKYTSEELTKAHEFFYKPMLMMLPFVKYSDVYNQLESNINSYKKVFFKNGSDEKHFKVFHNENNRLKYQL